MIPVFEANVKLNFPRPPGLDHKLSLLQPIEAIGPDAPVIAVYNRFAKAYADYLIDAVSNPDADVTIADRVVWEVIATPANTPEGMLLKLKAIGSQIGSACGYGSEDDWLTGDWGASEADLSGNKLEVEALLQLRADLRRISAPAPSPSLGAVSPDLAMMLTMWKGLDKAANKAMLAADTGPSEIDCNLKFESERACSAELSLRLAILNTPAKSLADMIAKFDVVRFYAESDDWVACMNGGNNGTESALWAICGDLLALGPVAYGASTKEPCYAEGVARLFRRTVDDFDAADEAGASRLLREGVFERIATLKSAASLDVARSITGALFQLAIVPSLMDQAIHSGGWRSSLGSNPDAALDPPEESIRLEREVYRLIWSAVSAIASAHGIKKRDYAGDFFIEPNPFETTVA